MSFYVFSFSYKFEISYNISRSKIHIIKQKKIIYAFISAAFLFKEMSRVLKYNNICQLKKILKR